jgi:hypothetical protein
LRVITSQIWVFAGFAAADSARMRAAIWRQRRPVLRQTGPTVRTRPDRRYDDAGPFPRDTNGGTLIGPGRGIEHVRPWPWPALAFGAATRYQTTRRITNQPGPARAKGKCDRDAATLDEWLATPAAVAELERALGPDGPARFAADARAHMAACNRAARRLYANFMTLVSAAARAPA